MNPINLFCFKTLFGLLHHANASKDFCETTAKKSAISKKRKIKSMPSIFKLVYFK